VSGETRGFRGAVRARWGPTPPAGQSLPRGTTHHSRLTSCLRPGASKVEIVVAAACLALLVAIAVPLIQSSRTLSRRQTCAQHVSLLTRAALEEAVLDGGRVPVLENGRVGWPALLLVQLRMPEAAEQVRAGGVAAVQRLQIPVFACPADVDSFNRPGGLSYVGNGGYGLFEADPATGTISGAGVHTPAIDLDGDGTVSDEEYRISFATGVFWRATPGSPRMTLEFIRDRDGLGQTMLITENLDAGTWTSTETLDIAFVIGREALGLSDQGAGPGALHLDLDEVDLGLFAPHADPARPAGRSPVPSSLHAGTIHVGFCDESVRPVSIEIDPLVYARLMTPAGTSYGQAGAP
jgi:Protein of unknown function (DUF1559)